MSYLPDLTYRAASTILNNPNALICTAGTICTTIFWNRLTTFPQGLPLKERIWRSLEGPYEVNKRDQEGKTEFYRACESGDLERVRALLDFEDINPNISCNGKCDYRSKTPLCVAYANNHQDIVDLLLDSEKVNVNGAENSWGILHVAASKGDLETVQRLFGDENLNANSLTSDGRTALAIAARYNNLEIVEFLLNQENVDPETIIYPCYQQYTLLHDVCDTDPAENRIAIFRLLVDRIDVNAQDKNGYTPLHKAVRLLGETEQNRIQLDEIVRILMEYGANPNIQSKIEKQTPLHWSCRSVRSIERTRTLLNYEELDIDIKDCEGKTPLYYACLNGKEDFVKLLYSKGADRNLVFMRAEEDPNFGDTARDTLKILYPVKSANGY
ncbi:MAG: hypothetical protein ChlgKO_11280 [Chlamydiales bacterium]